MLNITTSEKIAMPVCLFAGTSFHWCVLDAVTRFRFVDAWMGTRPDGQFDIQANAAKTLNIGVTGILARVYLEKMRAFFRNRGLHIITTATCNGGTGLKIVHPAWLLITVLAFGTFAGRQTMAVETGEPAPTLTLPLLGDGSIVRLSDFKGKVVYIDFWASWCGPCRQSLPLYESLYRDLASDHFQILAVNLDEHLDDAMNFLERHPVSYPVLLDPAGDSARAWSVLAMPTSYLVDAQGRLAYIYVGFEISHLEKIEHDIESLLEELQGSVAGSAAGTTGGLR